VRAAPYTGDAHAPFVIVKKTEAIDIDIGN
jgi:hypothetical protein